MSRTPFGIYVTFKHPMNGVNVETTYATYFHRRKELILEDLRKIQEFMVNKRGKLNPTVGYYVNHLDNCTVFNKQEHLTLEEKLEALIKYVTDPCVSGSTQERYKYYLDFLDAGTQVMIDNKLKTLAFLSSQTGEYKNELRRLYDSINDDKMDKEGRVHFFARQTTLLKEYNPDHCKFYQSYILCNNEA